jgi:hypothetical protein
MCLFDWSMDDKAPRNYGFVEGKRKAVLESGHASVYMQVEAFIEGRYDELLTRTDGVMPSAGGFPLRVGDVYEKKHLIFSIGNIVFKGDAGKDRDAQDHNDQM